MRPVFINILANEMLIRGYTRSDQRGIMRP